MAEFNQGGYPQGPRPMVDVSDLNLTCAECGTPLKELRFRPTQRDDGTYGKLYCSDCFSKRPRRNFSNRGGYGQRRFGGNRDFGGSRNE